MYLNIKKKITRYFTDGHERTLKAKKNILTSFFLKGGSVIIGFLLVPLTIKFVNKDQYGVWLTLGSIISWFSFFDIGLGNGLKNKLVEANTLKQYDKSVSYVSTTYAILTLISVVVFIGFATINRFLNWSRILNIKENGLNELALVVVGCFCLQFITQIINIIFTAFHVPSKIALINLIGQSIIISVIYWLAKSTTGSLMLLAIVIGGIPIIIQFLATVWYLKFEFKLIAPKFSAINFTYIRSLLNIGGVFFIIQVGALILYQTDNIIITQLFNPLQVTIFNIAYKLFSLVTATFVIILTPFWSAYTEAFLTNDYTWMRNSLNKTRKVFGLLSIIAIILFVFSNFIYRIWLHGRVEIPVSISLAMLFYAIGYNWINLHCFFINGIGKIKIQLYLYLISIVINLPMAIFLSRFLGVAGVTFSNVFIFIVMGTILFIQCNKILNKTATGLWNS